MITRLSRRYLNLSFYRTYDQARLSVPGHRCERVPEDLFQFYFLCRGGQKPQLSTPCLGESLVWPQRFELGAHLSWVSAQE